MNKLIPLFYYIRRSFISACVVISVVFSILLTGEYLLHGLLSRGVGLIEAQVSRTLDKNKESGRTEPPRRTYGLMDYGYFEKNSIPEPYAASNTQHLNPYYLFSFPIDPDDRRGMSNSVVSINEQGFRGPVAPPDKELAFLLGSSTAFGSTASSDDKTITGYLNQMQDQFYFVNAAVPSWNTTQEMFRLSNEIVKYRPKIVISYSLTGDIVTAYFYRRNKSKYEVGVPESFGKLRKVIDDIRGDAIAAPAKKSTNNIFPRLTELRIRLINLISPKNSQATNAPMLELSAKDVDELSSEISDRYIQTQSVMKAIGDSMGFKFLTVIEPMAQMHKKLEPNLDEYHWQEPLFRATVVKVLKSNYCKKNCIDMTAIFDRNLNVVKVINRFEPKQDVSSIIFYDRSHLLDSGHKIVANEIKRYLATSN